MNLWCRLLWLLLTLAWRKKVGVLEPSRLRMTVLPNDLDFNMHVNNGRYLTLANVGRIDFVFRTGVFRTAMALRARPVVGDAIAKFRRDLKVFQRYILETRLLGWDDKWIFIEQRFIRHGRVVGVVTVRCLWVNADGAMTAQFFVDTVHPQLVSPPLPKWVKEWSRCCDDLSTSLRIEEAQTEAPLKAAA